MASTWLMVNSGFREITGIIQLFLDTHPTLLIAWVGLWWCLIYFLYPVYEKLKITTHVETISIYYAVVSLIAGIGNLYLYQSVRVMI